MTNSLLDIAGVGPATARQLAEAGFESISAVAVADPSALAEVRGIGPIRAASLGTEARQLLADIDPVPSETTSDDPSTEERAARLRKQAKQLRKQAGQLTKKAKATRSKKKRKRCLREAARLEKKAKSKRKKAKKLLAKG